MEKLGSFMAMLLYRILYLPGLIVALPYYLYRMWRRGGYRAGFANRFGVMKDVPPKRPGVQRIWIQAVSVGELMAVEPLIRKFHASAAHEIILTTTTSTGFRVARDKFSELTEWRGIFPMDFWCCSGKAWRALQPDLVVLMEGELWPEHIHQAWRREVPVLLINARLSDRSFRRHQKFRRLGKVFYRKLDGILAGSETDLERFRQLEWIPPERIEHSGNLKLDVAAEPPVEDAEREGRLREFGFISGNDAPGDIRVLLGSSTWPGEERELANIHPRLKADFPGLRLLMVPRHAERRKEIEADLKDMECQPHFRSASGVAPPGTCIYVADTTGELKALTRVADIVFIGKSMPPNAGGQTPIEAAALGKPLLFGPDMSNFRDVSRRLVRDGAARQLGDWEGFCDAVRELLGNDASRSSMGSKAKQCIDSSRGATERTYQKLLEAL